jgi:hypothetical protein
MTVLALVGHDAGKYVDAMVDGVDRHGAMIDLHGSVGIGARPGERLPPRQECRNGQASARARQDRRSSTA